MAVTNYTHKDYELGFKVTEEEMSDKIYEEIAKARAAAFKVSAPSIDEIAAKIYNEGFKTEDLTEQSIEKVYTEMKKQQEITWDSIDEVVKKL